LPTKSTLSVFFLTRLGAEPAVKLPAMIKVKRRNNPISLFIICLLGLV